MLGEVMRLYAFSRRVATADCKAGEIPVGAQDVLQRQKQTVEIPVVNLIILYQQ
jgi:hypothetical protein